VVAAGAGGWISTVGGGTPTTANCSAPPSSPSGWTELDSPNNPIHEDFHVLVYDTAAASTGENTLYAGTDGGLFVSYDDGTTWTGSHNASPVMNSLGVSVLGDTILSGAWDVGVHWSFDHGATWQDSQNIDNDSTAVLATPSGWFAARLVCQSGVCIWQSAAQGASWSAKLQAVPPNVTFVELDGNVFTGGNADGNGNGLDVVYELGDASGNPGQYGPAFPDPNDVDTSVTAVDYQGSTYVIAGNQCAWAVNREYRDRRFYLSMAIASAAGIFLGFARTFYLKTYFATPALPLVLHVHGAVFTSWILFFVAQTALIADDRVQVHRRLGYAGAFLAGAVRPRGSPTKVCAKTSLFESAVIAPLRIPAAALISPTIENDPPQMREKVRKEYDS
jgi:hypothetical protein